MISHDQLNDEAFEKEFSACAMLEEVFTHEAHLRLAWIYLQKYGERKAELKTNEDIVRYTKFLGVAHIYNRTVTTAAVKIIAQLSKKLEGSTFNELLDAFPELMLDFKGLIGQHYSMDVFNSAIAKANYVEPDLLDI